MNDKELLKSLREMQTIKPTKRLGERMQTVLHNLPEHSARRDIFTWGVYGGLVAILLVLLGGSGVLAQQNNQPNSALSGIKGAFERVQHNLVPNTLEQDTPQAHLAEPTLKNMPSPTASPSPSITPAIKHREDFRHVVRDFVEKSFQNWHHDSSQNGSKHQEKNENSHEDHNDNSSRSDSSNNLQEDH